MLRNQRSPPPRNLKASVRDSQGHGGETLPREEAEKRRDKHGKTRSWGGAPGGARGCGARKYEYGGFSWKGLRWGSERGSLRPDTRRPHLVSQPWHCPPPPELFPGLPFPVRSPALHPARAPSSPTFPGRHPALNTLRTGPPHLKPPAPRWAPPCGNCPWRRRGGRDLGDRRPGQQLAALTPHPPALQAAPSLFRHPQPLPACSPPRSPPRRKCGGGGRGRHVEKQQLARASAVNTFYYTRVRFKGLSPKALWEGVPRSHGSPR